MGQPLPLVQPNGSLSAAQIELAILDLVRSHPTGHWRTSDLVRALGLEDQALDVVVAVTKMHRHGRLERVGPATYRWPTAPAPTTARHNDEMLWGEDVDAR